MMKYMFLTTPFTENNFYKQVFNNLYDSVVGNINLPKADMTCYDLLNQRISIADLLLLESQNKYEIVFIFSDFYVASYDERMVESLNILCKSLKENGIAKQICVCGDAIKLFKNDILAVVREIDLTIITNESEAIRDIIANGHSIGPHEKKPCESKNQVSTKKKSDVFHSYKSGFSESKINSVHNFYIMKTSSGCTNYCTFCVYAGNYQGKWEALPLENVKDELSQVKRRGFNVLQFKDPNFIGYNEVAVKRLNDFNNMLKEVNAEFVIKLSLRADSVNEEVLKILQKMKVRIAYIGIESGVQRILDIFNKNVKVSTNLNALKTISDFNIIPQMGFIFFVPSMKLKEIDWNIDFLNESKEYIQFNLIDVTRLRVFKNLKYYNEKIQSIKNPTENGMQIDYDFENKLVDDYYQIINMYQNEFNNREMFYRNIHDKVCWNLETDDEWKIFKSIRLKTTRNTLILMECIWKNVKNNSNNLEEPKLKFSLELTESIKKMKLLYMYIQNKRRMENENITSSTFVK